MSLFSFSTQKENISLLIDIDSGSVAAAFVSYSSSLPKILKRVRLSYAVSKKSDTDAELSNMIQCLDTVLLQLFVEKIKITHVSVVLSAPWCITETKQVTIEQDKKFIVTQTLIDDVLKDYAERFQKESTHSTFAETFGTAFDAVEKKILTTRVNGYSVPDSLGTRTMNLDMSVYISLSEKNIIQKISDSVFTQTHSSHESIEFHTFFLLSFVALRKMFTEDYVFMDVSGEMTSLSLIQAGILQKTISFPSGTHFIIRQITKALDVSPEIALSTLRLVLLQKLDQTLSEKVQQIIESAEKEWAIYFEDAVLSLNPLGMLPSKVFLSAPVGIAPLPHEFLGMQKTDVTGPFRKNAQMIAVDSELLGSLCNYSSKISFDTHLALSLIAQGKNNK